jgi:signal transduction histidine kinase
VRLAPGLPDVVVDPGRLLQVLANLLTNALKFTPAGGDVVVEAERRTGEVVFRVTDTGPGIPQQDLGRVFQRFWQAKEAVDLGTGLGLDISRRIVEAHGGRIWVDSQLGVGSTFAFAVPAAAEPVAGAPDAGQFSGRPSPLQVSADRMRTTLVE